MNTNVFSINNNEEIKNALTYFNNFHDSKIISFSICKTNYAKKVERKNDFEIINAELVLNHSNYEAKYKERNQLVKFCFTNVRKMHFNCDSDFGGLLFDVCLNHQMGCISININGILNLVTDSIKIIEF